MSHLDIDMRREALAAVEEEWTRAATRWDADALASLYSEDALFFGGKPGHCTGREAVREYFASYVGTIASGSISLSELESVLVSTDCVLAQGFAQFTFKLESGEITRSRLRGTLLFQRQGGPWKIRQHHFSESPLVPPLGRSG
jgi:uncharacterized protein (TIGR02246 family)